jgi:hypothetical protein
MGIRVQINKKIVHGRKKVSNRDRGVGRCKEEAKGER